MDTREKLRPWQTLQADLSSGEWTIVVGYFDPLTAEQAERIHTLARAESKLLVIVQQDDDSLLHQNARAALVAGLRDVTAVLVETDTSWRAVLNENTSLRLVEDRAEEQNRRMRFERFILERLALSDQRAR